MKVLEIKRINSFSEKGKCFVVVKFGKRAGIYFCRLYRERRDYVNGEIGV